MSDQPLKDNRPIPFGLLPDWAIRRYVPITPFEEGGRRPGKVSWGLQSYGYDIRLGRRFKVFTSVHGGVVDVKDFNPKSVVDIGDAGYFDIPPNHYVLAEAVEWIDIPEDVTVLAIGKSTYARVGIICNLTPGEAGWRGRLTLEISNANVLPARIHAGEGICQLLFFRAQARCDKTYGEKGDGIQKYQNQDGLTTPKVD